MKQGRGRQATGDGADRSFADDPDCIYRLSAHLGHTLVSTTEIYPGHLRRDGAMWRHSRDNVLFGSLAIPSGSAQKAT
ncbi:MAG TPA: hypothetical protein VMB34_18675 [Acetobacteraceae bacterium]|nr:hypothetical protein [Acetobacteraceae bacterium]